MIKKVPLARNFFCIYLFVVHLKTHLVDFYIEYMSLFNDIDEICKDDDKRFILKFIDDNYWLSLPINDCVFILDYEQGYIVNVVGSIHTRRTLTHLTEGFRFGTVSGSFFCANCQLETLRGAPKIVRGSFVCNKTTVLNDPTNIPVGCDLKII